MNDNLLRAVDAFSASPAIRLRYQILAAKYSTQEEFFLPSIDDQVNQDPLRIDVAARAAAAGHRLAELIRLRQEAADQIERLLTFLDLSDGIIDDEDDSEDAAVDDAGCDEDFDAEPSLGWTRTGAHGNTRDLELDEVAL